MKTKIKSEQVQPAGAPGATFTPGPWIVDDRHIHREKGLTYPPGVEPETDVVVLVDTDCHKNGLLNATDKANLRLIAAAPELLAALIEHQRDSECYCLSRSEGGKGEPCAWCVSREILTRLGIDAKARGNQ